MLTAKKLIVAMILATSAGSAAAVDPEVDRVPSASEVFIDAALVRPMGVVTLVAGAAVWVVSLPFTLPSGSVGKSTEALLVKPFQHTFKRPVGQLATCDDRPDTCTAKGSDK